MVIMYIYIRPLTTHSVLDHSAEKNVELAAFRFASGKVAKLWMTGNLGSKRQD